MQLSQKDTMALSLPLANIVRGINVFTYLVTYLLYYYCYYSYTAFTNGILFGITMSKQQRKLYSKF